LTGLRGDELEAVLIGGREPVDIVIAAYDPAWPARFAAERERIASALGATARSIEHIGSTAVPGLAAKPIVDVLVEVADPDAEAAYVPALEAAGYEPRVREPGHRMFRTSARDVHVHVWASGSAEVRDYLLLRDRLRADPRDRERYEQVKRSLARGRWADMNHYADAKSAVIAEIKANPQRPRICMKVGIHFPNFTLPGGQPLRSEP
jgi:GrpB-like predicted nucleotidyltransferase (UPF0157 family)